MTRIKIFDTTLRDGEQSPGVNLNKSEKLEIAKQLEKLGVDVIEAGFPAASVGDFEAVKLIADTIKESTVTALARCVKSDIDRAWSALKDTKKPRIHVFLATSPIHMKHKLKMNEDEVIDTSVECVAYAKEKFKEIEWSAEDATRSDLDFLVRIITKVIDAGATVINLPDTVGFTTPEEYGAMFKYVRENVPNIEKVELSTHCHNDLGLAVANTLAGIENGATQIEVSMNGIGERAGNAALEEIAVLLHIRKDFYPYHTRAVLKEIKRTSDLVSNLSGMQVQRNKAVIGQNAHSHESGIHQDGVLKNRETYEIITPELVGVTDANTIFLGKHSGSHAFKEKIAEFNMSLSDEESKAAFKAFKKITDVKKDVTDDDIYAILMEIKSESEMVERYRLNDFQINYDEDGVCTAHIEMVFPNGAVRTSKGSAYGSVEPLFKTFVSMIPYTVNVIDYSMRSVGKGKDSLAEAHLKVNIENQQITGRSTNQDVLKASLDSYINAVNRFMIHEKQKAGAY